MIPLPISYWVTIGLKPDPATKPIKWFDHEIPWKQFSDLPKVKFRIVQTIMFATEKTQDMLETNTISQKGPIEIKESKYGKVDPTFVAAQQKHLPPNNKNLQHSCTNLPSCLVVDWENTLIKRSVSTYDPIINQCASNHMLWHMHICQYFTRNYRNFVNLMYWKMLVLLNGEPPHSSSLKMIVQPDGSLTSGTLIKWLKGRYIPYLESLILYKNAVDTNTFQSWTSACNITLLNSMMS